MQDYVAESDASKNQNRARIQQLEQQTTRLRKQHDLAVRAELEAVG